jgi:hypothetical protein
VLFLSMIVMSLAARWQVVRLWVASRRRAVRFAGTRSGKPQGAPDTPPPRPAAKRCAVETPRMADRLQTVSDRGAGSTLTVEAARAGEPTSQ